MPAEQAPPPDLRWICKRSASALGEVTLAEQIDALVSELPRLGAQPCGSHRAVAPVRFGLVGYGFGARYFHAPLIASATECELVAVVTRSAERRALVAAEHPAAAAVDDLAGLLSAGAEAVAVSTPADTHIPLCRAAPASEGGAWGTEPQDRWGRLHDGTGAASLPTERGRWDTYYPTFAGAVRGTGPVPVDPRGAVSTAEVLDAARTSATRHTLVDLPSTP